MIASERVCVYFLNSRGTTKPKRQLRRGPASPRMLGKNSFISINMSSLPYVTAPGNIEKVLAAIKSAATPERVSQDFVKTILGIKGGSGDQITSFLKKIGFAAPDGKPTEIYTKFRNPSSSGNAAYKALKHAYAPLYARNEYMHKLKDAELKGLILEETGLGEDSNVPGLILAALNALRKFADFSSASAESAQEVEPLNANTKIPDYSQGIPDMNRHSSAIGLNLSYTINLNLPATSDISVFNAIFKSLKENLLRGNNE